MRGSLKQRTPGSWTLIADLGPDPATGKRRQKWRTIKCATRREAQRELTRWIAEIETGSYREPTRVTVGAWLQTWIADHAGKQVSPASLERYRAIVDTHLTPRLGALALDALRPVHVAGLHADLARAGLGVSTIRLAHAVLRQSLRCAVRLQVLTTDPTAAAPPPRQEPQAAHVLETDNVGRLLSHLADTTYYLPVLIALTTGLRRGEILGLQWADLDLDAATLSVRRSLTRLDATGGPVYDSPKSSHSRRRLQMPRLLVTALRDTHTRQQEHRSILGTDYRVHDLVCAWEDGRPLSPGATTHRITAAFRSLGIDGSLHSLRHTHASLLVLEGVHMRVISERLGHSGISITMDRYAHLLAGVDQDAADRAGVAIERLTQRQRGTQNPTSP